MERSACRSECGLACAKLRPALQHAGTDAGGIDAGLGEQILAVGVVLELIRQAQVQYGQDDAFGIEQFGHAGARAAHHHVVLDGDEALVALRQLEDQVAVQRFHEAHVHYGEAQLAAHLLGRRDGRGAARGEEYLLKNSASADGEQSAKGQQAGYAAPDCHFAQNGGLPADYQARKH